MGAWTLRLCFVAAALLLLGAFAEPTSMEWQMEPSKERFVEAGAEAGDGMQQCGCTVCPCTTACGCVVCPCTQWRRPAVAPANPMMDMAGRLHPPRPGVPVKKATVVDGRKRCPAGNCDDIEPSYGAVSANNHPASAGKGKPDPIAPWARAADAVKKLNKKRRKADDELLTRQRKQHIVEMSDLKEGGKKTEKRAVLQRKIRHARRLAKKEEDHKNKLQLMEAYQKSADKLEVDKEMLNRKKLMEMSKQEDQFELSEATVLKQMQAEEDTKQTQEGDVKAKMRTSEQKRKSVAAAAKAEKERKKVELVKQQGPEKALKYQQRMHEKKKQREENARQERGHKKNLRSEQKFKKESADKEFADKKQERERDAKDLDALKKKEAAAQSKFQDKIEKMQAKIRAEAEKHIASGTATGQAAAKKQADVEAQVAAATAKLKQQFEQKKQQLAAKQDALKQQQEEKKQKEREYKHHKASAEIEVKNVNRKAQEEYKEKKSAILSKFKDIKDAALREDASQKQAEELREKDFKAPLVEKEMKMKSKCLAKGPPVVIAGTAQSVASAASKQLKSNAEPAPEAHKSVSEEDADDSVEAQAKAAQEAADKEAAMEQVVEHKYKQKVAKRHRRRMKLAIVVARARLVVARLLREGKSNPVSLCIQSLVKYYTQVGTQAGACKNKITAGQSLYCFKHLKHDRPSWYSVVQSACASVHAKFVSGQCGSAQAAFIKAFAAEADKCKAITSNARYDCYRKLMKKRQEMRYPAEKVCAVNKKSNMLRVLTLRVRFPRLLTPAQQLLQRKAAEVLERRQKAAKVRKERAAKRAQDREDYSSTERAIEKLRKETEEVVSSKASTSSSEETRAYKKRKWREFKRRRRMLLKLYKQGKRARAEAASRYVRLKEKRVRLLRAKQRAAFEAERKAEYAGRGTFSNCAVALGSYFSKVNRFGADCLLAKGWNRYYCLEKIPKQHGTWFTELVADKCSADATSLRTSACGQAKSAYSSAVQKRAAACIALKEASKDVCESTKSDSERATCSQALARIVTCYKDLQERVPKFDEYEKMKEACKSNEFSKNLRKMTQLREL